MPEVIDRRDEEIKIDPGEGTKLNLLPNIQSK
jgi:hypothetical protein